MNLLRDSPQSRLWPLAGKTGQRWHRAAYEDYGAILKFESDKGAPEEKEEAWPLDRRDDAEWDAAWVLLDIDGGSARAPTYLIHHASLGNTLDWPAQRASFEEELLRWTVESIERLTGMDEART